MKWVFWLSAALITYTYGGYPFWLYLRSRWRPRPVYPTPISPTVSIVMAVHNEAEVLAQKLKNLTELNYPADRYEVVVVSDGSTDGTNGILRAHANQRVRVLTSQERQGKASALNRAIPAARGEIIVFTDARQMIERNALRHLVGNFADPTVGCVSGEILLGDPSAGEAVEGAGRYWQIEKKIRQWEGAMGSLVAACGALYAARKHLLVPLPPETILDDLYLPLHIARQGAKVTYEPRARGWDTPAADLTREFRRKVRTLTGNYQLVQLAPWLLSRANPVRFAFVSHKLLRLLVPFALGGILLASLLLDGVLYRLSLGLQSLFYGFGALSVRRLRPAALARFSDTARTFLTLNAAAIVALINFIVGKKQVWVR